MAALQTANEMALVSIEQKDEKIIELTNQIEILKKTGGTSSTTATVLLEEQVFTLK